MTELAEGDALDVAPAPFDYNPSGWGQRVPIAIVAMIGAAVAGYMALYPWRLIGGVWLVAVAAWLMVAGRWLARESAPSPPASQNWLLVGLVLAMLAIVPTRSSEPPVTGPRSRRGPLRGAPGTG